jgi:hypothetical protein
MAEWQDWDDEGGELLQRPRRDASHADPKGATSLEGDGQDGLRADLTIFPILHGRVNLPSPIGFQSQMTDTNHPPRVSDILSGIAAEEHPTVSVSDVTHAFGDRAFGALMFVFAAPLALPMPPGVSAVLGAPLLFITVQWMIGRRTLWLPSVIANRTMSRADYVALMGKLTPYLSWLERRLRRRATFMYGPVIDRLTGLVCVILAGIVFLPIPFGNMLPSFAIAAFALGLAERDGLAALIGWLSALVSVAILALVWNAILAATIAFFGVLGGTIGWITGLFG